MNNNLITYKTVVTFTDIERQLLGLARDGYRQKEMCLFVSRSRITINRYFAGIQAKLGARTSVQAVALAMQKGIIGAYNGEQGTKLVRGTR